MKLVINESFILKKALRIGVNDTINAEKAGLTMAYFSLKVLKRLSDKKNCDIFKSIPKQLGRILCHLH